MRFLFVAPTPLDAEEISRLLDVSRSNVSTSLRELITWGVVRRVHIIGDRRDRFEALKDVMETFRVIMAERKRREMDPTIALLEHCVHEAKLGDPDEQYTREQLEKMLDFTRMVTNWYGHIDNLSTPALLRLFRGGSMLAKVFGRGNRPSAQNVERPGEGRRRLAVLSASDRPRRVIDGCRITRAGWGTGQFRTDGGRSRRAASDRGWRLSPASGAGLAGATPVSPVVSLGRHKCRSGRGFLGSSFRLGRQLGFALSQCVDVGTVRLVIQVAIDHGLEIADLSLCRLGQDGRLESRPAGGRRRP